ncbi:unnamed protein product [Adineta ricciae]|uniref:NAD(P)(+)--arginine ADP-ribosyltransferase n=1 Tax=Adineta ricciae TaxID=249248 RepID=A0A814XLN8_ADIRI|nr:unnamed protein product [Adineta ricciae]CAF1426602.1 unnamed protein product [Adineta ricciae]
MENQCYIGCNPVKIAYEWHLNDKHGSAMRKSERLHLHYTELYRKRHKLIEVFFQPRVTIKDLIHALKKGYLYYVYNREAPNSSNIILECFDFASEYDDIRYILFAYTCPTAFSKIINTNMAKNTYHELRLYCTPLNCIVLAHTQDGIQVFLSLMYHPSLDQFVCKCPLTVYRGAVIHNPKLLLEGYENGSTIITTTFLSTSLENDVADIYSQRNLADSNEVSLFCTYHLHNERRRTALNLTEISKFSDENEILIYPYVPFQIDIIKTLHDGKRIEVVLSELMETVDDSVHYESIRAGDATVSWILNVTPKQKDIIILEKENVFP